MQSTPQRMTAEISGEFVVFLIGARVKQWWRVRAWLPVMQAMPEMLKELRAHPELGLLAVQGGPSLMVQYWRSLEHLHAYAQARENAHLPAWRAFNQRARQAGQAVGIWHETYVVKPGQYENVYVNMPPFGLGRAAPLIPATGPRQSAQGRLNATQAATMQESG